MLAAALQGEEVVAETTNASGKAVYMAAKPIPFHGVNWVIAIEQTLDEMHAPLHAMQYKLIIVTLMVISVIGLSGITFARRISRPLVECVHLVERLHKHETDFEVHHQERGDEIGTLARALEAFRMNTKKYLSVQSERERRNEELDRAIRHFEGSASTAIEGMASTSLQMQSSVGSLARDVNSIASSTEELSASINEITSQIDKTSQAIDSTVRDAAVADEIAQTLQQTTNSIGEVSRMIAGIADKINLLALNATIESAHAGEAGKGFAVVAAEIKNLASQTSRSTDEIEKHIANVQEVAESAVEKMQMIRENIEHSERYASGIAAAAEEQSVSTNEISSMMQNTNTLAEQMQQATQDFSEQASDLGAEVRSFLEKIRRM